MRGMMSKGISFSAALRVAVDREGDAGLAEDVFGVLGFGDQVGPVLADVPLVSSFHSGLRGLSSAFIISSNANGVVPFFRHLNTTT